MAWYKLKSQEETKPLGHLYKWLFNAIFTIQRARMKLKAVHALLIVSNLTDQAQKKKQRLTLTKHFLKERPREMYLHDVSCRLPNSNQHNASLHMVWSHCRIRL